MRAECSSDIKQRMTAAERPDGVRAVADNIAFCRQGQPSAEAPHSKPGCSSQNPRPQIATVVLLLSKFLFLPQQEEASLGPAIRSRHCQLTNNLDIEVLGV